MFPYSFCLLHKTAINYYLIKVPAFESDATIEISVELVLYQLLLMNDKSI